MDHIVNEVLLPVNDDSESFDAYVNRNAELINQVVEEHRRQFGYDVLIAIT